MGVWIRGSVTHRCIKNLHGLIYPYGMSGSQAVRGQFHGGYFAKRKA